MVNGIAILLAVLTAWPAPGYAARDKADFAHGGIEEQIAWELMRYASLLQQALAAKEKATLAKMLQLQFQQNQFFATCGVSGSAVRELAGDELQLRTVGKLAKSGNFFVSTDRRWLVKAVSLAEKSKLAELGKVAITQTEYSDCSGFNHSLLLPIPLSFIGTNRKAYLVMRNETERLANRIWPEWQVAQIFDVKPLPNLAGQLAELIITLSTGWLGSFEPLSTWDGWDDVSNALHRDCRLLTWYKVVDFSLFIHVLQRTSATHNSAPDLSATDGCITEPSQAAVVCFAILDYLLPFGYSRRLESLFKGDKFHDYGEKMMHAFACIGDLNGKDCQAYHDYGTITSAGKEDAKVALLGSESFRQNYECQVERPKLRYEHKFFTPEGGFGSVITSRVEDEPLETSDVDRWSDEVTEMLPAVLHGNGWVYDGSGYDANVSSWLQEAVSSSNRGQVVASGYEQLLEQGLGQLEKEFELHEEELDACKRGIELFATSSWNGYKSHKDLGNIIWSSRSNSIFVVRGKSKLYSNSKYLTEMRKRHCFMLLRFFRCRALDGKKTSFDYMTSFGSLEVLQVVPSVSSGHDFKVFRKMRTSLAG